MPQTIPFDAGLVLGNIIDPDKIQHLKDIANAQKGAEQAHNILNEAILSRHKLNMILQELINLNVKRDKIEEMEQKLEGITNDIAEKAIALADASINASSIVAKINEDSEQSQIYSTVESPIDYDQSDLKQLNLSSDTMNMDVQYIRNETNQDQEAAHSSSVASHVSFQVSGFLSPKYAAQMSSSAKAATYSQTSKHTIEGTVVITVNCTHRRADVFSPFVLDVDKAINSWNMVKENKLNSEDIEEVLKASKASPSNGDDAMQLLSGQTLGSSFVGMVHIVQVENSTSSQRSRAVAASVSTEIEYNLFLAKKSGKFGLEASYSDNLKSLFSASVLQSHCSVITMGCIPTIASNVVETTVARMAPNPKQVMAQLAAIQGGNDTAVNNMGKEARKAQVGESFMELNNSYVTNVVSEIGSYDNKNNKVIDMNSLMTALDNFVLKAEEGQGGVPINFFLKPITKKMLAKVYLQKYYPDGYQEEKNEDEEKKSES